MLMSLSPYSQLCIFLRSLLLWANAAAAENCISGTNMSVAADWLGPNKTNKSVFWGEICTLWAWNQAGGIKSNKMAIGSYRQVRCDVSHYQIIWTGCGYLCVFGPLSLIKKLWYSINKGDITASLKGQFTSESKIHISPLTCSSL